MKRFWTEAILKFVYDNSPFFTDVAIARQLTNITGYFFYRDDVTRMRHALGLKKTRGRGAHLDIPDDPEDE